MSDSHLNDRQLLRYSRQIFLPEVDQEGQERLAGARVLVVGLGGLGSPVALYLAAAGVGTLVLSDPDTVELSNLQRQILHTTPALGRRKTESARETLTALNPEISILTHACKLTDKALLDEVAAADLVVDGTDNFESRFAVNRACVVSRTPLIYGAVVRLEGQVSVFRPDQPDGPCYACLYRDAGEHPDGAGVPSSWENCTGQGVLGPVAGLVGCIQATEALKLLTGAGTVLAGRLLLIDAAAMEFQSFHLEKDPDCRVCGGSATGV